MENYLNTLGPGIAPPESDWIYSLINKYYAMKHKNLWVFFHCVIKLSSLFIFIFLLQQSLLFFDHGFLRFYHVFFWDSIMVFWDSIKVFWDSFRVVKHKSFLKFNECFMRFNIINVLILVFSFFYRLHRANTWFVLTVYTVGPIQLFLTVYTVGPLQLF